MWRRIEESWILTIVQKKIRDSESSQAIMLICPRVGMTKMYQPFGEEIEKIRSAGKTLAYIIRVEINPKYNLIHTLIEDKQ